MTSREIDALADKVHALSVNKMGKGNLIEVDTLREASVQLHRLASIIRQCEPA